MAARPLTAAPHTRLIESVASQLVSIEHRADGALITTPLMYPSGSLAIVRVDVLGRDRHFVTDMGMGYLEAEMMGTALIYARNALLIAERSGMHFDHHAFSLMDVSRDRLPGAIVTLANASQQAVAVAAYKQAEKRIAEDEERLYERLVKVFTAPHVNRGVPIVGASNTTWRVSNVVRLERKVTVFEPVSRHPNSVTTAATKFHDLARLDDPPNRVAVVENKEGMGTYLGVLAQAANVITRDAPDGTLQRLAA
jgi:hypothetical protein